MESKAPFRIVNIFKADHRRWEGVPLINIYLLRLMFILMIIFLGKDSWTRLFSAKAAWSFTDAMSWCVWATFALVAVLGIFRPLKVLPVVLLEILYKVLWLIVVFPHWQEVQQPGSTAEYMANGFLWVPLPILAMPWPYFWKNYIRP